MKNLIKFCLLLSVFVLNLSAKASLKIAAVYDDTIPHVQFAVDELQKACEANGGQFLAAPAAGAVTIKFALDRSLGSEAYKIVQQNKNIQIKGGDAKGLMYGGLALVDNLQAGKDLLKTGTISGKPYMPYRGIKFNIPLDARNPSYDDTGDAAQKNIETMWEFDFWKNYLDNMARYRYNLLTLWNLHPFPSMVKVPGYEDVALNDVCVYTGPITDKTDKNWRNEGIQAPEHLRVVKKMTIDEKIAFWKKVFKYADDRGIDIHMYHWNVHVSGAEGKYGIVKRQDNPEAIAYLRESVKQFMLTYPTVKGIGVTAGESIDRSIKGEYSIENFIWLTYGKGIMEAREINPKINCTFIFRQHELQTKGAARPSLAVAAMAGIDVRQYGNHHAIADQTAAAAPVDGIGHGVFTCLVRVFLASLIRRPSQPVFPVPAGSMPLPKDPDNSDIRRWSRLSEYLTVSCGLAGVNILSR